MLTKQLFGSASGSPVNLTVVSCHKEWCSVLFPPKEKGYGGVGRRKMMVVKEGFLTLLYLTLDMKNAT